MRDWRDRLLRDLWCHHDVPAWQGLGHVSVTVTMSHKMSHSALTANTDTRHWLISLMEPQPAWPDRGLPEPESGQGRCSALSLSGGWRGQRTGHSQAAGPRPVTASQPHQPPASQELNKASRGELWWQWSQTGARRRSNLHLEYNQESRPGGPLLAWDGLYSTLYLYCSVAQWLAGLSHCTGGHFYSQPTLALSPLRSPDNYLKLVATCARCLSPAQVFIFTSPHVPEPSCLFTNQGILRIWQSKLFSN